MFVRWNDTLKYYEYDTSAGQTGAGPWLQLPNVAYKDQNNIFTTHQTVRSAVPYLAFNFTPGGLNQKNSRFEGVGDFYVSHTNDADNVYLQRFRFARDGNLTVPGKYYEQGRTSPIGEWISYAPTWRVYGSSDGVVGNGALNGRYMLVGKTVYYTILFSTGTTSVLGPSFWAFGLPFPVASAAGTHITGSATIRATSGSVYIAQVVPASYFLGIANHIGLIASNQTGSTALVYAAVPFTWTNGDNMWISGFYEMA